MDEKRFVREVVGLFIEALGLDLKNGNTSLEQYRQRIAHALEHDHPQSITELYELCLRDKPA